MQHAGCSAHAREPSGRSHHADQTTAFPPLHCRLLCSSFLFTLFTAWHVHGWLLSALKQRGIKPAGPPQKLGGSSAHKYRAWPPLHATAWPAGGCGWLVVLGGFDLGEHWHHSLECSVRPQAGVGSFAPSKRWVPPPSGCSHVLCALSEGHAQLQQLGEGGGKVLEELQAAWQGVAGRQPGGEGGQVLPLAAP